jgi:hypothetical protein
MWLVVVDDWQLRHDVELIAEVACAENEKWKWPRHTTVEKHGVPPANGVNSSLRTLNGQLSPTCRSRARRSATAPLSTTNCLTMI